MGRYKTRRSPKHQRSMPVPQRVPCMSKNGTPKLRFTNEVDAYREASYQSTVFNRPTRAYLCPVCDGWHTAKNR